MYYFDIAGHSSARSLQSKYNCWWCDCEECKWGV